MDAFLRPIAILIEVLLLGALFYHMLNGLRIALFDVGMPPKYSRMIATTLVMTGSLIAVFIVSHLITFYPTL